MSGKSKTNKQSMKKPIFFMRFYGQTDENIQKVIDFVLKKHPTGELVEITTPSMTASLGGLHHLQQGTAKEVQISFPTDEDFIAVYGDKECQEFYMSLVSPGRVDATFTSRLPGDTSFGL